MGVKKFNPNPGHKKNILAAFQVPSNLDPELQQFLQSVKESVENASGNRGQPLERFVTLQELQDVGLIGTVIKNRRGEIGGTATASATGASSSVPPAFFPFGDLTDVLITAPADGSVPRFNASTTNWEDHILSFSDFGGGTAVLDDMLFFDGTNYVPTAQALTFNATVLSLQRDLAGLGGVGSVVNLDVGAQPAGTLAAALVTNINQLAATGGSAAALAVLATEGSATVFGLAAFVGVNPIVQLAGTFNDLTTILNLAVDETVALSDGGGGAVTAFVLLGDDMTFGLATMFEELQFTVAAPASNGGIKPIFEFSTGVGTWDTFVPLDGTDGLRRSGVVEWQDADLVGWAVGTGSEFLIRMTRDRNQINSLPVLDLVQTAGTTTYSWDDLGDLSINNILVDGLLTINDYVFPGADGTADQVLRTDGAGAVTFETINHQRESFEAMSDRFLITCEFTDPAIPAITTNLKAAAAGTGAFIGGNTIDPRDHPGIWTLNTGTTAVGRVFIHTIAGGTTIGTLRLGGGITRVGTWLRTGPTLSTGGERYTLRAGLSSITLPNIIAEGVTFEYDDSQNGGRWQAICGDAPSVETSVDTGVTVAVDTWYKLEFEVNAAATSVEFFIDDASVATITTNIPSGGADHLFYSTHIMKLIGTTARELHIDAMYAYQEISR